MTDNTFLCENCGGIGSHAHDNHVCDECGVTICEECLNAVKDMTLSCTVCPHCDKIFADESNCGTCDQCGSDDLGRTYPKVICRKHTGVPTDKQLLAFLSKKAKFKTLDKAKKAYKAEFKDKSASTHELVAAIRASAANSKHILDRIDKEAWKSEVEANGKSKGKRKPEADVVDPTKKKRVRRT